jgi:hypothetical protein
LRISFTSIYAKRNDKYNKKYSNNTLQNSTSFRQGTKVQINIKISVYMYI